MTVHVNPLEDGIVEMRLDRPPVNALNPEFLGLIEGTAADLADDPGVRAVVVAGAGRSLSGGMDLKEMQGFGVAGQRDTVNALNATFRRLYGFPKPMVAAAHGGAIAGGLFFVLVSDYRIAGEGARFGLAEIRVGLRFPVVPFEISRAELSPSALRRFMQGGANHDAASACDLAVVDEVVDSGDVMPRALAVARDYAALPPDTFAQIKRAVRGDALARIDARLAGDGDPMAAGWFTDESVDAIKSVLASLAR